MILVNGIHKDSCLINIIVNHPAVMAQWLGCNHKVASSSPVTAMSSFGDWFTQP